MTRWKRIQFLDTVLHELAHQWFGNVITPKWWNDLWIIEAYATFMSFEALEQACKDLDYTDDEKWEKFVCYKNWSFDIDSKN